MKSRNFQNIPKNPYSLSEAPLGIKNGKIKLKKEPDQNNLFSFFSFFKSFRLNLVKNIISYSKLPTYQEAMDKLTTENLIEDLLTGNASN